MKPTLIVALCAVFCAGPTAALAQDEDDWEFAEDPAQNLSVAAVRYDAGLAILAQCRSGALAVVVAGLPPEVGAVELQATRADGRRDVQTWAAAGAPGAIRSLVPARDARFMRGGGGWTVRTAADAPTRFATTFDLPTQSANLDRVLTACGWDLNDDRDQLARATGFSFTDPDAEPFRMPRSRSRSVSGRGRQTPPPASPSAPTPLPAEQQISCIVQDLRLTACRALHAPVSGAPDPAEDIRALEGGRIYAADGAALDGKVVYAFGPRTTTVIEYIGTIRSN